MVSAALAPPVVKSPDTTVAVQPFTRPTRPSLTDTAPRLTSNPVVPTATLGPLALAGVEIDRLPPPPPAAAVVVVVVAAVVVVVGAAVVVVGAAVVVVVGAVVVVVVVVVVGSVIV